MDTKLKKSHKLAVIIIALIVLIPAFLLVSLYPTMEEAMLKLRKKSEEQMEAEEIQQEETLQLFVDANFVNYAMEASYYIYGQLLNESGVDTADFSVLQEYGWVSDYHRVYEGTAFIARYGSADGEKSNGMSNTDADDMDNRAFKLTLIFDAYGNLAEITTEGIQLDEYYGEQEPLYELAMRSEKQYQENVLQYNAEHGTTISGEQLRPKNFTVQFAVEPNSFFAYGTEYDYADSYYPTDPEVLYCTSGAVWLVVAMAVLVILFAFLLPFVKALHTGREKLFSLPFEGMAIIGMGAVSLTIGMYFLMAHTTRWELTSAFENHLPEFLGYEISVDMLYLLLRCVNFVGWALGFFLLYITASGIRQMIVSPLYYLKNQVLCVRIVRWFGRQCKKLYRYVTDIDINEKLHAGILKVVLANFAILLLLCCLWWFGVVGLIIYSVVLYILLRKYGEKVQTQYHSILHATEQMAEGDLKISLEKDLGMFAPIGESLERVQQGFEKAVVEEAKSQNMKTELITNVSHDLKTPLTAIITYVDLLKQENITEEERKSYIATLEQKSQRLKVLIEDLFEVSKAHSGNVKMNFMDVDVVSLLKQVRSEMDEQIQSSDLQFRWNLPEEKVVLSLDGQRTYRVFENLLNNILKYAMPHSRVYVDLIQAESEVQIRFRNVSAMELDFDAQRLTDRFVRGDSSRNTEGSGLGLAIAKSFVELQKGTFQVETDGDLFKALITFYR